MKAARPPASADDPSAIASRSRWSGPLSTAGVYAMAGAIWILGSDRLAQWLFPDLHDLAAAQTVKGLFYIASTALLVWWLARRAVIAAEQELAAKRLPEVENLLETVLQSLGDAVLVVDMSDRRVLRCNPAAERLFGWPAAELVGDTSEKLHVDRAAFLGFLDKVRGVLEDGRARRGEIRLRRRDGEPLSVEYTLTQMRGGTAAPGAVITLIRDVGDRKAAEAEHDRLQSQLAQAQKMESIGRLAGGVAHDFNNILQAILGYGQLLETRLPAGSGEREHVEEILRSAQRAAALTRQLLAFSRKEAVAPRLLDVNGTVEGLLKMVGRIIGEDIELDWRPGHGLPRLRMDPGQLGQVLTNLVVNARDASRGNGRISISTDLVELGPADCRDRPGAAPGRHVTLSVRDHGAGMDAGTRARIFEPFFTTKGPGEGTGLGLSTVYGIARQNGGFVEVDSEVGRGTSMTVFLPVRAGTVDSAMAGSATTEPERGRGETVLLVEDEEPLLRVTERLLVDLGYRVVACRTPEAALEAAGDPDLAIDLLLTDVIMPHLSGRGLRDRLRETRPGLKCLFMTGHADDVVFGPGGLESGSEVLEKPYSRKDLAHRVRRALGG